MNTFDQFHSEPVRYPLGASAMPLAWYPQANTPRFSAVSRINLGESTWQVRTSMPWSTSELAASASFTGMNQSPVKMTVVVMEGFTDFAPRVNALMLRRTWGIGVAAMKPSLLVLVVLPAV